MPATLYKKIYFFKYYSDYFLNVLMRLETKNIFQTIVSIKTPICDRNKQKSKLKSVQRLTSGS